MTDFPEIAEARVVHVEPGDVIWLRPEKRITASGAEEIRKHAQEIWPDNLVVIGMDIDLAVVKTS